MYDYSLVHLASRTLDDGLINSSGHEARSRSRGSSSLSLDCSLLPVFSHLAADADGDESADDAQQWNTDDESKHPRGQLAAGLCDVHNLGVSCNCKGELVLAFVVGSAVRALHVLLVSVGVEDTFVLLAVSAFE